jgi:hypothetical protein
MSGCRPSVGRPSKLTSMTAAVQLDTCAPGWSGRQSARAWSAPTRSERSSRLGIALLENMRDSWRYVDGTV